MLRERRSLRRREQGGKPPPPPLPPGTIIRTTSKAKSKATWPAEAASSANMGHPQGWEQGEHHSTDPRTAENAFNPGRLLSTTIPGELSLSIYTILLVE